MSTLKNEERSQINNLTFHFKTQGNGEQNNPKVKQRKSMMKIRVGINETE